MHTVAVPTKNLDAYAASAGQEALDELRRLAKPLGGLRVVNVNATPTGGGVAEILRSEVPLMRDLGLAAEWRTIEAEPAFFEVTKKIHNALQGAKLTLTEADKAVYIEGQQRNATQLFAGNQEYDVVVIHDPQPLGLLHFAGRDHARWAWRLHIDSSSPQPEVWAFLRPFLDGYNAAIFTLAAFAPPDVPPEMVRIIAPAIDPLTPKNRDRPYGEALATLAQIGLDPGRPLVAQVARLDPWKDPIGVIDAYRLAREQVPGLQLALLGVIEAVDDPEAVRVADDVRAYAAGDPDIHVYTDPAVIGQPEVAAVQLLSQAIFQKSLKEGFGLTVSEAMWKATPVIGGNAGGIPLQLQNGQGGFLVDSVASAGERCSWLLNHPPEARVIAARGRERVRDHFLITRLLADNLRLYGDLMGAESRGEAVAD